jgi:site-specific DNA-adenine methylase
VGNKLSLGELINKKFPGRSFNTILSPFCGGCSVEFHLQNKFGWKFVLNDIYTPLITFWRQTNTNRDALCLLLRDVKRDKTLLGIKLYRKEFKNLANKPLLQAVQYFCLNRWAVKTQTLSRIEKGTQNIKHFTLSSIERIKEIDLYNVEFHNQNFDVFLENFTKTNALIFLDPPDYVESKFSKFYSEEDKNFNYDLLFDKLDCSKMSWILVYNDCKAIRKLYKNYQIFDSSPNGGALGITRSVPIIVILSNNNKVRK